MRKIKVIARYLPQFHVVKENDEWWGKGFTEWTTVKGAEQLFLGHNQPRIPLNNYYYNLLQKETMAWQANLAKRYGVDCFSFYHYWFKDGRQILEKPAENLLKWKDINIEFCFTWANQSWVRTWSKLMGGNTWTEKYEKYYNEKNDDGILLEQKYGVHSNWLDHINYLIPFFKDDRYLKRDNKPVFVIYHPFEISCLTEMIDCWNDELNKNGFDGIYLIGETHTAHLNQQAVLDANLMRFPDVSFWYHEAYTNDGIRYCDYSTCWDDIVKYDWYSRSDKKVYICAPVDFDTTPRREYKGYVLTNTSVDIFRSQFKKLLNISEMVENEYVFLNAWNEWGEGAYLEPDNVNEFGFLESVLEGRNKSSIGNYKLVPFPNLVVDKIKNIDKDKMYNMFLSKNKDVQILAKWVQLAEKNIYIYQYLRYNKINSVSIYGMGYLGKLLFEHLYNNNIEIAYCIDKNAKNINLAVNCYTLDKSLPKVDLIIVTPCHRYSNIYKDIKNYIPYNIISLEHILNELY